MVGTGIKTDKPFLVANYLEASFAQKWKKKKKGVIQVCFNTL